MEKLKHWHKLKEIKDSCRVETEILCISHNIQNIGRITVMWNPRNKMQRICKYSTWQGVVSSTGLHNFHEDLMAGDPLQQKVLFQRSHNNVYRLHSGSDRCLKSNSSMFHRDSTNPSLMLILKSLHQTWVSAFHCCSLL